MPIEIQIRQAALARITADAKRKAETVKKLLALVVEPSSGVSAHPTNGS